MAITMTMTVLSTVMMACFGLLSTSRVLEDDSKVILSYKAEEGSREVATLMNDLESAVTTTYLYGMEVLPDEAFFSDKHVMGAFTSDVYKLMYSAFGRNEHLVGAYWRFNDDRDMGSRGFYLTKNGEIVENATLTDYLKYDRDDVLNTGWYYRPMDAGEPCWMGPYYDNKLVAPVVTYAIPIFDKEGEPLAVVGMSVELSDIFDAVESISIYDSGEAFLISRDGRSLFSSIYPKGILLEDIDPEVGISNLEAIDDDGMYRFDRFGKRWRASMSTLPDGAHILVAAPEREINAPLYRLLQLIVFVLAAVCILTWRLVVDMTSRITMPIEKLRQISEEIKNKNFDVAFPPQTEDEIGALTEALKVTTQELKHYTGALKNEAYTDSMTGLGNDKAFDIAVTKLKDSGRKDYAVYRFGVGNVKAINEKYGHAAGDAMIVAASEIISQVFGARNVYRMSSDEFVGILMGADESNFEDTLSILEVAIENFNSYSVRENDEPIVIAAGGAIYKDNLEFEDVVSEADKAMLTNKLSIRKDAN